jgi:glyoxylase-like metal-dependent hydrolase (beta-lactamase superfamily II)
MNQEKEIHLTPVAEGIYMVETYYLQRTQFAGCYIVVEGDEAAVVETNTNYAVPMLIGALEQLGIHKNNVKYIILTHIHLDHAGGAGLLMKELPEAQLVVHPRGKKHMINPEKLIESVKHVYGEEQYVKLYGDIMAIPKERVTAANDGDVFKLGGREFQLFDTPGHAKHHHIVFDKKTASVFSGDNFGIGYPRMDFGASRLVFPSTSPTQFEPEKALETYRKIVELKPNRVLLTHYGPIEDIDGVHEQLKEWIRFSKEIAANRYAEGLREGQLVEALQEDLRARFRSVFKEARGSEPTPEEVEWLEMDTDLNGQGIAHYINKLNS